MWIAIALIVILIAGVALCIVAWLSLLFGTGETPLCPRCGGRTRKFRMRTAKAAERVEFYRCRECGSDPTPDNARHWARSRLKPPQ